jgi:hypothetical protein
LFRLCVNGGPGVGDGGIPGSSGENCLPLGNVLIIQESEKESIDDNFAGGVICFEFSSPVDVISIGLLNIPSLRGDFLEVEFLGSFEPFRVDVLGFGKNSVQRIELNLMNVKRLCLYLLGEGAVTDLLFCNETSLSSFVPSPIPVAISDIPSLDFSINISSGFPSSTPSALPTGSGMPSSIPSQSPSELAQFVLGSMEDVKDSFGRNNILNARGCDIVSLSLIDSEVNNLGVNVGELKVAEYGLTIMQNFVFGSEFTPRQLLGRNFTFKFSLPISHTISLDLKDVQGDDSFIEVDSGDSVEPIKVDFFGSGLDIDQTIGLPFNNVRRVSVFLSGNSSLLSGFKFCTLFRNDSPKSIDLKSSLTSKTENDMCSVESSPCLHDGSKIKVCKYDENSNWKEICLDEIQWRDAKKVWTVYCGACDTSIIDPRPYRPVAESVVTESPSKCNVGNYGASNIEVITSDENSVLFTLKHSFEFSLEKAQIWFRDSKGDYNEDGYLCFDEENISHNHLMGRFMAKCVAGWAKVNIIAERNDFFKQTLDADVATPICQKGFDFVEFNPMKRCHWVLNVPCNPHKLDRHLTNEATMKQLR